MNINKIIRSLNTLSKINSRISYVPPIVHRASRGRLDLANTEARLPT